MILELLCDLVMLMFEFNVILNKDICVFVFYSYFYNFYVILLVWLFFNLMGWYMIIIKVKFMLFVEKWVKFEIIILNKIS